MRPAISCLIPILIGTCVAAIGSPAVAKTVFTGPDFSGVYACTGNDSKEGPYTGTVTLKLVRSQSVGKYGAYEFSLEVPGYGTYPGEAATHRTVMAAHFALTDQVNKDYGTGIARFSRNKAGKWQFRKYYYEPEFKGGNHGLETCVHR